MASSRVTSVREFGQVYSALSRRQGLGPRTLLNNLIRCQRNAVFETQRLPADSGLHLAPQKNMLEIAKRQNQRRILEDF